MVAEGIMMERGLCKGWVIKERRPWVKAAMRGQKGHWRDEVIKEKGLHRFREVGLLDGSDFGEKGLLERWGLLVRWGFGGLGFYKRKGIREQGYEREGDWERWDY